MPVEEGQQRVGGVGWVLEGSWVGDALHRLRQRGSHVAEACGIDTVERHHVPIRVHQDSQHATSVAHRHQDAVRLGVEAWQALQMLSWAG